MGTNLNLTQVVSASALTVSNGGPGVLTGNYAYVVSFGTDTGETESGEQSAFIAASANALSLSNIPVSPDPSVTKRFVYRTQATSPDPVIKFLVVEIDDNVTTTYLDNIPDSSLGQACPRTNTTGGQIVINGFRMYATDGDTTIIGRNACPSNRGYSNTFVSANSGTGVTYAWRNVGVGNYTLFSLTTGTENAAYAVHSLNYLTTGKANTANGYCSGMNIIDGSFNCFYGNFAGLLNPGATSNQVLIGYRTFMQNLNVIGSNVALGSSAGWQNLGGHHCIFLGNYAGAWSQDSNLLIIDGYDRGSEALELEHGLIIGRISPSGYTAQWLRINGELRSANATATPSATQAGGAMSPGGVISISAGASTTPFNAMVCINGNGPVGVIQTKDSITQFLSISDERAKCNIDDSDSVLAEIMKIQVRKFDFISGGNHVEHGLIAQELHKVCDDAVSIGNDEIPWMVDNSKLVPMLIKAVQELSDKLDAEKKNTFFNRLCKWIFQ